MKEVEILRVKDMAMDKRRIKMGINIVAGMKLAGGMALESTCLEIKQGN